MSTVETQDVLPVRSRVSWGAILAGGVIALAVYLLLSALGVALGLSLTSSMEDRTLGIGAAVWAVLATLIALFLGGWVASQCTAGETTGEAVIYGLVTWGVVFAILLWLTASGMRLGISGLMSFASSPAATALLRLSDEDLRTAGFTQDQINGMRDQFNRLGVIGQTAPGTARALAEDPRTTAAAWWAFGGILLSMFTAVGGAVIGAGPNFSLARIQVRATGLGLRQPVPR